MQANVQRTICRQAKKVCGNCATRRALFRSPSRGICWDRDHDLCFRCYASLFDRCRPIRRGRPSYRCARTASVRASAEAARKADIDRSRTTETHGKEGIV